MSRNHSKNTLLNQTQNTSDIKNFRIEYKINMLNMFRKIKEDIQWDN